MHSDTLTPLAQFVSWLGLDAWKVAGIDKDGSTTIGSLDNTGRVINDADSCECFFQHPYDSDTHWSRDDLIDALRNAEDFFVEEAYLHPVPYQITDEGHGTSNRRGFLPLRGESKTVLPAFKCGEVTYGEQELVSLGEFDLVREDQTPSILDSFILTFTMSNVYSLNDVRLYFSTNDFFGRKTDFDFNCHIAEIRPFASITSETDPLDSTQIIVTIVAPAYLFKKPILDDATTCLSHELDTYVESVEVFVQSDVSCSHGRVECPAPCVVGCDKQSFDICLREKWVYKKRYAEILFLDCSEVDGQNSYLTSTLNCVPKDLYINYVTGKQTDSCKLVENKVAGTIHKLALALHDCDKRFCKCDICSNSKLDHYRSVPKVQVDEGDRRHSVEDEYQVLVDKVALKYVDGLHPSHGMIQSMREIARWHRCSSVEASYK